MSYSRKRIGKMVVMALALAVWLGGTAQASIVLSHTGDNNPSDEGWIRANSGYPNAVGMAVDDGGTPAWWIKDGTTSTGTWFYKGESALTPQNLADIGSYGFSMRATLKVDDFTPTYDETQGLTPGIQIAFEDLRLWHLFSLGSNDDGNTTWKFSGGSTAGSGTGGLAGPTLTGVISGSGYNDYELLYDAPSDSIDVLINGSEVVTDYVSHTKTGFAGILKDRIYWGSMDTPGVGAGYWTSVQFEAIPEPSSVVLLLLGLIGLTGFGWRRRE